MDREAAPAASPYEGGGSAAGGKFRRRPYRRPTPYDRPPLPPAAAAGGQRREGWLSKIASGASRFFPSLLSKSLALPSLQSNQETTQEASHELPNCNSDSQTSESSEQGGSSDADEPKGGCTTFELVAGDKSVEDTGLASIEQLVKQKTFSRHEFNRLMEILRSRTSEVSDVDRHGDDNPDKVTVTEAPDEDLRKSVEERPSGDNQVIGNISNWPIQTEMYDELGSSPVEIAKAFMGSRTSALSLKSQGPLKDKRFPALTGDFASSSISSPALKSPTCWPGAMVKDVPGFLTPQTLRGRAEIHHRPQTPYHGAVHSRSGSKFKSGGEHSINLSLTRRRQPYTPVFGSSQKRNSTFDDGFATVGPIRRIHQKSMVTNISKEASSSRPGSSSILQPLNSNAFPSFLSSAQENMEAGTSTSSMTKSHNIDNKTPSHIVGASTVHPQSTANARKILEHLDRTFPSPKEKAAEFRLAVARNKPSPEITAGIPNGQPRRSDVDPDSQRSSSLPFGDRSQGNGERGKDLFHNQAEHEKADEAVHFRNTGAWTSKMVSSSQQVSAEQPQYKNNDKNWLWPMHNQACEPDISGLGSATGLKIQKHQPHSSGSKPALSSISITKANGKHPISTNNGSGFTFPVSWAFAVSSEPPTPSVMPSFASETSQPEGTAVPSFKFGSSSAARGPDFSFASTSSSAIADAAKIPKFDFGSDKKTRISFKPVGKDAICY